MEKVVDLFGVGEANYQLSQIQQGLFIGSVAEATNKDLLKSSNITHVLTVAVACAPPYPDDFVYKVIEVADRSETDLTVYFDECFSFIDQAIQSGGGVLVHCFMGMSRSVTIVVAYLMKKHGMGFSKAMELIKSRRPQAFPNSGFISQLQQFEKSIQVHGEGSAGSEDSVMMNSREIPNKSHEPHDDQKTYWFRAVKDFFL